jgi:NADH-quinone oxidoreductase subunit F
MGTDDLHFVDEVVARVGRSPDAVIPVLQAIQEHFRYLPRAALERVCAVSEIQPATLWGIATFYDQFRHQPVGEHVIHVCHGTACHVTGADRIEEALRRHLKIPAGHDTDPTRKFTIESVACLGCCTLAPVVKLENATYGHLTAEKLPHVVEDFLSLERAARSVDALCEGRPQPGADLPQIHVGLGSCCMAKGSDVLFSALVDAAHDTGARVFVKRVGCVGMCHQTPLLEIRTPGRPSHFYSAVQPAEARQLVLQHFRPRGFWHRATRGCMNVVDRWLTGSGDQPVTRHALNVRDPAVSAFLGRQVHIATQHFGHLDPLDLEEYLAHEGFQALHTCLKEVAPRKLIEAIEQSGLRGRGGAGFLSGAKWRMVQEQSADSKCVICNGDEGDPGAFMDRMLLESFPFRIIEGLAIAAVAVGAHDGIFYIRREYPLAVSRIRAAIEQCEKRGWLGDRLMGTDYPLRLSIKEGAGAFVCGEETALIASIEGRRGRPRLRPPFPAESGLWGKPTLINNVETLALVPWIMRRGPASFAALGTPSSKGTKVFALAGKVLRGGLIEVPMGTTIREIVEEIGGGVTPGRRFKAVQIGGPSGGCVPARLADTPVDYESLSAVGAIMGSGGLVVLDDTDCMVDIARYFLRFTQEQSCGKCTFCRVGTRRMLDLLDRLCTGHGRPEHLVELERLAPQVASGSLCGLGKTAPNPVLTTLRYFRSEYEAHLQGRCPAKRCSALIRYEVTSDCTGCTICAQHCPVDAIPMTPYQPHTINQELCTRCDTCRRTCPVQAIEVH